MTTYLNVPYELLNKLDLAPLLKKAHIQQIKDEGLEELTALYLGHQNGWMDEVLFTFKINRTSYNYRTEYNTSSPYALYIDELYLYKVLDEE
jgi:hypothetical protein